MFRPCPHRSCASELRGCPASAHAQRAAAASRSAPARSCQARSAMVLDAPRGPLELPISRCHIQSAVRLVADLLADVDDHVGTDAQDVGVKGAVMEPAEGQAVRQDGLAPRVSVRKDVRAVEESVWRRRQIAHRSWYARRTPPPEALLVEAPAGQLGDVPASSLAGQGSSVLCPQTLSGTQPGPARGSLLLTIESRLGALGRRSCRSGDAATYFTAHLVEVHDPTW